MTANCSLRVVAAQTLLRFLSDNDYPAVICGGYARDAWHDKPIRDIDLYVCRSMFNPVADLLFGPWEPDERTSFLSEDVEYVHQSITFQMERTLLSDYANFHLPTSLVNLIGLNPESGVHVDDVTMKYNLGLCKIGIDEANGLILSSEFVKDSEDKQITLFRTDWGYEATMKQFIKLQAKYPWPLRIKEQETFDAEQLDFAV